MFMPLGSAHTDPIAGLFPSWSSALSSSLTTLQQLAGATEQEFLQIGSQLQEIYQHSLTLSQTAHQLVETASGERLRTLIDRLREIFQEMNTYLDQARTQNLTSYTTLANVSELLNKIGEPLVGVRRMCKHLYILEVSIKIESAHLGDMGSEFINLAMDIKQLSQQTKGKVNAIEDHRQHLQTIIAKNRAELAEARETQDAEAETTLSRTAASLTEMENVSGQFSQLGDTISANSLDCSDNISTVVQSMQFHDIFRQQVEHVIAGLEGLQPVLAVDNHPSRPENDRDRQAMISRTGDVCELQEAQLQYAAAALFDAVTSILESLRDIGAKQKKIAGDVIARTGGRRQKRTTATTDTSFIAEVSRQMHVITGLLSASGSNNQEMAGTMQEVAGTVRQITGFVTDIENIGHDIIQIALNARIKAASTGEEGASLSVLAEEIGQMSGEAVQRTDLITTTLTEIHDITDLLATETLGNQENLSTRLSGIEQELHSILSGLDTMGGELVTMLALISDQITSLSAGIEGITDRIDVHERTKSMADEVLAQLREIIRESRRLYPASDAFKEDLRQMAHRYTMESERRIHEHIASKHGIGATGREPPATEGTSAVESEFGDNVDLF